MKKSIYKFRGRRKNGPEWLYGDLNHVNGKTYIFPRTEDTPLNGTDWFEVDPSTVGRFLNITDTNNTELYEGDLLQWGDHCASCHEHLLRKAVIILNPDIQLVSITTNYVFRYGLFAYRADDNGQMKHLLKIGDIHTNPEAVQFRIYNPESKKFIYGNAADFALIITHAAARHLYPFRFGIYAGKNDKNGKFLYTGDVFDVGQTINGQSRFLLQHIGSDGLDIRYAFDTTKKYEYDPMALLECEDLTIMGNIIEHPNLCTQPQ